MSIDIADLFKYGWMLLLTIIPRHLSSMNDRFKALEKQDDVIQESIAESREAIAVIDTKVDALESRFDKLEDNISALTKVLTEVRIAISRQD